MWLWSVMSGIILLFWQFYILSWRLLNASFKMVSRCSLLYFKTQSQRLQLTLLAFKINWSQTEHGAMPAATEPLPLLLTWKIFMWILGRMKLFFIREIIGKQANFTSWPCFWIHAVQAHKFKLSHTWLCVLFCGSQISTNFIFIFPKSSPSYFAGLFSFNSLWIPVFTSLTAVKKN